MKRLTGRIVLEATGKFNRASEDEAWCTMPPPESGVYFGETEQPTHILRVVENTLVETEIAPPRQMGQRFRHPDGDEYILAQCEALRFALVALSDGNRFRDPVKVMDHHNVSAAEWKKIAGDEEWTKISTKAAEPATVMVEPTPDATVAPPEPDPAAELRKLINEQTGVHTHHLSPWYACSNQACRLARAAEAYLKGTK